MTTKEFETALKSTNSDYVIDQIIKPEGVIARVIGYVPWGDGFRKVIWLPSGECFSKNRKRLEQFDIDFNLKKI